MLSIEEFVDASLEGADPKHALGETEDTSPALKQPIAGDEESADEEYGFGEIKDVFEAGMRCEPKRLYPKHNDWTDELPDKLMDQAYGYGDAWKEYAILLRTNLDQGIQRLHSVVIQSPLLKSKLNSVLEDYPGFFISENNPFIEAPFTPFVHCWDIITQSCDDESETSKHMRLLISALEPELQEYFSIMKEFQSHGMIRFDQLWVIFKPGCFVFAKQHGMERIYKLSRTETRKSPGSHTKYFLLDFYYIDWDGSMYGHALDIQAIEDYQGSKKYIDLGIYPLDFHPEHDAVVARLVERGRKFCSYTGVHYMAYDGLATESELRIFRVEEHVSGRVVLDTETYMEFHPNERYLIQRLGIKETKKDDSDGDYGPYNSQNIYINAGVLTEQAIASATKKTAEMGQTELTEDSLMICCSTVRGYSLTLNIWMNFRIDSLRDIVWNENAFESLALPGNHKELLLAFAQTQGDSAVQFDDVIEGKGKGMVILLEGPPGLGKTLTVESVAEEMKAPIYKITSSQMRASPESIKLVLQDAFRMAKAWKGVVLLDEADVFLEMRSINNLTRNQLVSVFLQHLEYFEGTIFLTTNRIECIDPAFESRIHLSLTYPKLTQELRHKIWKNFIRKLEADTSQITAAHLDKFAAIDMNGRQIKNTVKMAGLLAANKNHCLTAQHVEMMLAINQLKKED